MAVTREAEKRVGARLLSVGDVAEKLNCSPRHVRRLADRGAMPRPVRVGRLVRWRSADIEQWIVEGCPAAGRARK